MARWIRFIVLIIFGLGLGLAYGWIINPTRYVDTAPNNLRIDYKTDYVLMTAEAFQGEQDLDLALHRLALLGDSPAAVWLGQAIEFAQKAGYSEPDIARIQDLLSAVQAKDPKLGTPPP